MFVSDIDCEVSGSPMFAAYLIHQYMYVRMYTHVCVSVIEGLPPFRQRKQAA